MTHGKSQANCGIDMDEGRGTGDRDVDKEAFIKVKIWIRA